MRIGPIKIETVHGDVRTNARATRRWFKVIAWALQTHPEGLFLGELRQEYQRLCELQGSNDPYTDDGDFQGSLSRQLNICLAICQQMGWVTYSLEKPARTVPARPSGRIVPPPRIPQPRWILTKKGSLANGWSDHRLGRSIAVHLFRVGITPWVEKLRLPLGLASVAIGVAKLVMNWGTVQSMFEGVLAIAGGLLLALIHPTHPMVSTTPVTLASRAQTSV